MSGSAPYLKKAGNGYWYVHWTEKRVGKRVSTSAKDLDGAKTFFRTWLLMEAESPHGTGAELKIEDIWSVYKAKHIDTDLAAPDTAKYAWMYLAQHFGALTVAEVSAKTEIIVSSYVRRRAWVKLPGVHDEPFLGNKAVKLSTVRRELATLIACFNWCADPKRKLIDPSLVPPIDLPPEGEPADRWLRTPEIQKLLDAAVAFRKDGRLARVERFLWIALDAPARMTAILELTWDRVDFETNVIHFNVPGRKKTKKRRASVPISSTLLPVLERAYKERVNEFVCDNTSNIWATVQIVAEKAGFGPVQERRKRGQKPKATGVSPKVLRHTAATHMARRGVPLWKIAKILGNTLAMVEKVYAKHCPDDLREAVDTISGGTLEPAE